LREKTEKPEIQLITSALKQFEANESLVAAPGPQVKAEQSEPSLAELALYMKSRGGGFKGSKGHGRHSEECDWGNTKERKGVCWRCGRENHLAKNCIADMPEDMSNEKSSIMHISPAQVRMMNCSHLHLMRDVIIHFANWSCMVPGSEGNSNGEGRSLLGNG